MSSQASIANIPSLPVWSASGCVGEAQQGGTTMAGIVRDAGPMFWVLLQDRP
ncbi:hypothetical protein HG717_00965 [Rhodococcus erythropolis]|uniref:hypothetical protein n=1 Tax=Rhodococcus TaxID=1827 RepID=UPI0015F55298|nr:MULTISPECIES: hypothetical protein [Rhodococcus]MBY6382485.1 hypothetical protein [Rhodococcus erythropolis]